MGLGYLVNHTVSTKLAIDIALMSSYCVILNHPVTWSIMVMDFIFKFYFCPFLNLTKGPIRSTQIFFRGILSASLAGNLLYCIFYRFIRLQVSKLVTSFRTTFIMPGQF